MSFIPRILRQIVRKSVRRAGYRLEPIEKPAPAILRDNAPRYERILPASRYCPWNLDADFTEIYRRVSTRSLVDVYRCWELWSLLQQLAHVNGAVIEVGVWRGATGAIMARRTALSQLDCPIYLCDTFRGVAKAGSRDTHYVGGEHADTSKAMVEDFLVRELQLPNVVLLEGIFPDETADRISPDTTFRLCHCDVDVYESAKVVTQFVWPKLAVGGVIVYDDYGFVETSGVTEFVNEQVKSKDRLVIYNLNGHAVVVKVSSS